MAQLPDDIALQLALLRNATNPLKGGTAGWYLGKNSDSDFDYTWHPLRGLIPGGGTTGQSLVKASNADQDVTWGNAAAGLPITGDDGTTFYSINVSGNDFNVRIYDDATGNESDLDVINSGTSGEISLATTVTGHNARLEVIAEQGFQFTQDGNPVNVFVGDGSPNGVVTSVNQGDIYIELALSGGSPQMWQALIAGFDSFWYPAGALVRSDVGISNIDTSAAGVLFTEAGAGDVVLENTDTGNIILRQTGTVGGVRINGGAGGIQVGVSGSDSLGFFGATPTFAPSAIAHPSGGVVIDTQARAAINSIVDLLSAAAGGYGLTN